MLLLFALQVLLPLALAAWLWLRPSASLVGRVAQVGAAGFGAAASLQAGLWTIIPWWLGSLAALAAAGAILRSMRFAPRRKVPRGASRLGTGALAVFAVLAIWLVAQSSVGRVSPTVETVNLDWPLAAGRYAIANGGSTLIVNAHRETADLSVPRYRLFYGQSLAVDIVGLGRWGGSARSGIQPSDPKAYAIYRKQVVAPCAGTVAAAHDGEADQPVPFVPTRPDAGNFVLLRCASADILLAHLAPGSVTVAAGDRMATGDPIGKVGNSGSTNEPHLHLHAQRQGNAKHPFSGEPVPIRIGGRWMARSDRFTISE